ncbi:MAG: hypothetical protein LC799_11640, partial [Actinobacteria bacterium]|nr:hypothetical protein [Actinomycetota bacterium]
SRVPAVLGILMYFNIHSGSCAPAEHDLPSLATIFSQTLSVCEATAGGSGQRGRLAGAQGIWNDPKLRSAPIPLRGGRFDAWRVNVTEWNRTERDDADT